MEPAMDAVGDAGPDQTQFTASASAATGTASFVTQAGQKEANAMTGSPVKIEAYFSRRGRLQPHSKPTASEVHQQRKPAVAAQLLPMDAMQHQVIACRGTPQPTAGSQLRWPDKLAGGLVHPLDDRKHMNWFGYRELRWKKHFIPESKEEGEIPQLALEDIVLLLTSAHGSLKAAFDKLDFFQDGMLSVTEWQEGLFRLINAGTKKEFLRFKGLLSPRNAFDARARKLFRLVDKDRDGLVSYEDLADTKSQLAETSREFSRRRTEERWSADEADRQAAARRSPKNTPALPSLAESLNATLPPASPSKRVVKAHFGEHLIQDMRNFTSIMLAKFENLDKAYLFFTRDSNGQLAIEDFVAGARELRFKGNARAVFKELDADADGNVSRQEFRALRAIDDPADDPATKTPAQKVIEKKARSPIQAPGKHERGVSLAATHIQLPEGERIATSAGFYTFPRTSTGRLDHLLHPDELPGFDAENFSKEHGPGYCKKGPDYFPEVMSDAHPVRGNKFKVGSCVSRVDRFAPAIPSVEGKKDLEHSAATYASYEGQLPKDTWKVNGGGAHSIVSKRERMGPTLGSCDSFGLLKPQAIGPWEESRMTLRLKSSSMTSLKSKNSVC